MRKRVFFIHPAIHNINEMTKYLCIDNEAYTKNLDWDSQDPQIVFVSEMIYNDSKCFASFKRLFKKNSRVFVFQGGEAVFPDLNIFDYAITQASDRVFGNRVRRMPPHIFYKRSLLEGKFENSYIKAEAQKSLETRKFCNFIYSNPYSHPMRDNLFFSISNYKKVDSLGAHLNNTGSLPTRRANNWAELSIILKSNYKFSIACENALCEGYTSEKMLASFQAHSIPIYWGNPLVSKEYNQEAFINCHSFDSIEDLINKIKEVDNNDELWIKMVTSPWQTKDQLKKTQNDLNDYLSFMKMIIGLEQIPKKEAPVGTFMNIYYEFFFRRFRKKKHLFRSTMYSVSRKIKLFFGRKKHN